MKKNSLFWKILLALVLVSVIPTIFSGILLTLTYQEVIDKYLLQPELGPITLEEMNSLHRNLQIQIGLNIFLIVILVTFSALILSRNFFSPLKKLNEAMKKVAQGKLGQPLEMLSSDEFGELIQSFNKMVSELKTSRAALEEAKTVLEIKVAAKTKELQELAEQREQIIAKRTKELRDKIEQLEKFHRLAVGRELKMIELKKELKALREKLAKS